MKNGLGALSATALVAGNMIGSGVFVMPASIAAAAGPLSLVALLVVAGGFLCLTRVFAELGNAMPISGGPSAFVERAFGARAGFVTAALYWLCVVIGNAAFMTAFVGYLAVFFPVVREPLPAFVCAQVLLWTLVGVNALGSREAGAVQVVTTILKVVPLIVLAIALIPHADVDHLTPFAPKGAGAFLPAISLVTWLFLGSESITVPGEEVKGGGRAIRRAAYRGFFVATFVYIAAALAVFLAIPSSSLENDPAPLARAGRLVFGSAGEIAITIAALISIGGVLNGWLLVAARAPLAAARSGIAPAVFGDVRKGLIVSSSITSTLVSLYFVEGLLDAYNFIALLATATSLVALGGSCLALLKLGLKGRGAAIVGFFIVAVMIAGSGTLVIVLTAIAGALAFAWASARASQA